jgi:hypothetical protein
MLLDDLRVAINMPLDDIEDGLHNCMLHHSRVDCQLMLREQHIREGVTRLVDDIYDFHSSISIEHSSLRTSLEGAGCFPDGPGDQREFLMYDRDREGDGRHPRDRVIIDAIGDAMRGR